MKITMNETIATAEYCPHCKTPVMIRFTEIGTRIWIPHKDDCKRPMKKVKNL